MGATEPHGLAKTVTSIVEPSLHALGVELVDVEHRGVVVRVVVDEPGGIGLDRLGQVTKQVSTALDEADPISVRYTLEVSSPGVERALRTPRHFQSVIGQRITFKFSDGERSDRLTGELISADEDGIDVRVEAKRPSEDASTRRLPYRGIDRARTVFEWAATPKPGKGSKPGAAKASASRAAAKKAEAAKTRARGAGAELPINGRSASGPVTDMTTAEEQG